MTVLLLRLAGPMQSWGSDSRFARRDALRYPTKSGVLGLLAAADGRRRTDPLDDLAQLRFGVRIDQPGRLMSDFQTAHDWTAKKPIPMPLSTRYYLADALFVAGVEGDPDLLTTLDARLREPKFLIFLGRRSCPTTGRVSLGLRQTSLDEALTAEPWHASTWHRRSIKEDSLPIFVDAGANSPGHNDIIRDEPISFDPRRRSHGWREVAQLSPVKVGTPTESSDEVDFFTFLGGL